MRKPRPITLPKGAEPQPWHPLAYHEVSAYRREGCPHYALCLSHAALRLWEGFTCIFCPLADQAPERPRDIDLRKEAETYYSILLKGGPKDE